MDCETPQFGQSFRLVREWPENNGETMTPLTDIIQIASEISGLDADEIDVDAPLFETGLCEEELAMVFARAAERNGVMPRDIENPQHYQNEMYDPAYVRGLRELALLFPSARARLDSLPRFLHDETFRSWAQSIEAGSFVPAGAPELLDTRSANPFWVVFKYGAALSACYLVPTYFLQKSCVPLCNGAFDHSVRGGAWLYPTAVIALIVFLVVQLGPAISALRRSGSEKPPI